MTLAVIGEYIGGLCSCVSYIICEVEFVEMKYYSLDCHLYSLAKYENAAPVTIVMFASEVDHLH